MCSPCGLAWDINDPDPPQCRKVDKRRKAARTVIAFDEQATVSPDIIISEMEQAYVTGGMRAAYRVALETIADTRSNKI